MAAGRIDQRRRDGLQPDQHGDVAVPVADVVEAGRHPGDVDVVAVVSAAGIVGVLVGAGIGLVPGCAVQVVLTGLYATGVVPLATLAANALSQDGDALFPLIVMDRRAAVVATVITTVPGVVVGSAMIMAA